MSPLSPKHALCVLHLEDSPTDRELVQELFAADGLACQFQTVETRAAFEAALDEASKFRKLRIARRIRCRHGVRAGQKTGPVPHRGNESGTGCGPR